MAPRLGVELATCSTNWGTFCPGGYYDQGVLSVGSTVIQQVVCALYICIMSTQCAHLCSIR